MHVLVDQNGYELLNTGDLAMLGTVTTRLHRQWPDAQLSVACHAPGQLMQVCPDCRALGFRFAEDPRLAAAPRRLRLAAEQAYKALSPLAPTSLPGLPLWQDRSLRQAVKQADLVIGSGGGYVCDDFWWHGAGVLSTLDAAQRRGVPTAMFGQGLGPLRLPPMRLLAARVLSRLDVLTLREARHSARLLADLGVLAAGTDLPGPTQPSAQWTARLRGGGQVSVSGDEALGTITDRLGSSTGASGGRLIGVTVRRSGHTALTDDLLAALGRTVRESALRHGTDIVALPVSRYQDADDLESTRAAVAGDPTKPGPRVHLDPLPTVDALLSAAGRCRVVVSASYHAGVFPLAQGIPVVGLSATPYYHDKLTGLEDLFPGLAEVVDLTQPEAIGRLPGIIDRFWDLDDQRRAQARRTASELVSNAEAAFRSFATRGDSPRREGVG